MLLNKMAVEDRYGRPRENTITASSKINATFQQGRTRAQLNASVDTYTDESNNDVLRGSRQKWRFKARNGKAGSLDAPMSVAGRGPKDLLHSLQRLAWLNNRRSVTLPNRIPAWTANALSKAASFCKGFSYYGASQFTNPGSCPVSFEIERDEKTGSPFRLRGHARILYNMYSASKDGDNNRYRQFLDIVGPKGLRLFSELSFREVPTSSIDHSVQVGGKVKRRRRRKLLVVPQFRIGKQRLSPNQLSEGTFKTLALLFHVITGDSTALLIEEPEVCVHQGLLNSILELIKTYSDNTQMIISTHSDYVLDHVAPENVYRVTFDNILGTLAHYIPKTMTAKEFAALHTYLEQEGNLGEYWREGGLGDRQ